MSAADALTAAIAAAVAEAVAPLTAELAELRRELRERAAVPADPDQELAPADVRRLAGCRETAVYRAIRDGKLPAREIPRGRGGRRCWRIRRQDAVVWARSRGSAT